MKELATLCLHATPASPRCACVIGSVTRRPWIRHRLQSLPVECDATQLSCRVPPSHPGARSQAAPLLMPSAPPQPWPSKRLVRPSRERAFRPAAPSFSGSCDLPIYLMHVHLLPSPPPPPALLPLPLLPILRASSMSFRLDQWLRAAAAPSAFLIMALSTPVWSLSRSRGAPSSTTAPCSITCTYRQTQHAVASGAGHWGGACPCCDIEGT